MPFMCEMLEVSRAGYYAWLKREPSARALKDEELTALIIGIGKENEGRYGIDWPCHSELAPPSSLIWLHLGAGGAG